MLYLKSENYKIIRIIYNYFAGPNFRNLGDGFAFKINITRSFKFLTSLIFVYLNLTEIMVNYELQRLIQS